MARRRDLARVHDALRDQARAALGNHVGQEGQGVPYSQTEQVGRYLLVQRGEKGPLSQSWLTVNAGDEQRSDVRPKTFAAQVAQNPRGSLLSAVNRELWPYLAGAGLVVLTLEWLVYAMR